LRYAGWSLADAEASYRRIELIDWRGRAIAEALATLASLIEPALCVFLGIDCGRDRAKLLGRGSGDALPGSVCLPELDLRSRRLWSAAEKVPRRRRVGPLVLDLMHRDVRAGGRWLALHPREFGLVWRLADRPGEPVSRARLLRDVWRLDFDPGTNSLEVHVSRLRSKLAEAGLSGLIETCAAGGYRLAPDRPAIDLCGEERLCA
jgi:DNA-binding response OmpR family regulator